MTLGEWLKKYRDKHGISMQEMANKCGFSKAYVGMLEKGINPKTNKPISPTIQTFEKIARATGNNVDDFIKMMDKNQPITIDYSTEYYHDPEVARLAQELKENPGLHVLMDASRGLKKESLEEVKRFVEYQKAKELGDFD